MNITIKEVKTAGALKSFVNFQPQLYKGEKYYVQPLNKKELNTLNKSKNPAMEFCDARYWLALSHGKIVGRIAGIINHKFNETSSATHIRFGWFDCIDDQAVASLLLEVVENWGKEQKMQFIHGPLGFISFDRSGVLVDGFEEMPTSFGSYNYAYYNRLIMDAGYEKDVDWVEHLIIVPEKVPEKISKMATAIMKRFDLKQVELRNHKDVLLYANQLFAMLNSAYEEIYGFVPLTDEITDNIIKDFIDIVKTDFISILTNKDEEVVGFGIATPSLVKAFQKAKGRLFPFGFIHMMKALKKNDVADMLLIGVRPDYQNKGLHALVFNKITQAFINHHYKYVEMTRVLEHNNKLLQLFSMYDIRQHKRARCYIKEL